MFGYLGSGFRKPAAQWAEENPILTANQFGQETDTLKVKQGNGVDPWNSLPYSSTITVDAFGRITSSPLARATTDIAMRRFSASRKFIPLPTTAIYPATTLYPSGTTYPGV